ncbi:MAG: GNAT family N-acetyltransferase [Pseudobdellovibrionaceae bacterium]|nr:GNAT family N-acetyltransferase [Bdellovibrionales bacterium]USN48745.1 MAG: GNAT family N-acetyltransferase [Pseudobdellovibrionaceae bacterium]
MSGSSFEPLAVKDAPRVFEILQSHKPHRDGLKSWTLPKIEQELRESKTLGVRKAGELIAFLCYRKVAPEVFEVSLLATHYQERHQGHMSQLFLHLNAGLTAKDVIWLEVHAENQGAQAFYREQGFTQVGQRPGYYADGGDAYLYSFSCLP